MIMTVRYFIANDMYYGMMIKSTDKRAFMKELLLPADDNLY